MEEVMGTISKVQFDILCTLNDNSELSISELASILFHDADFIEYQKKNLETLGYLNDEHVTKKGVEILNKHRIDNAIILAAGMSTRFVPFNYEMPKGLLEVKSSLNVKLGSFKRKEYRKSLWLSAT